MYIRAHETPVAYDVGSGTHICQPNGTVYVNLNASASVTDPGWELVTSETTVSGDFAVYSPSGSAGVTVIPATVNSVAQASGGSYGWAQYADTQYTSGSPFSIVADVDTVLPNNAGSVLETYMNHGSPFYDGSVITGANGDGIIVTVDLKSMLYVTFCIQ